MKLFTYKKADDPLNHIGIFIHGVAQGIDLQHAYMLFERNRDPEIKHAFSHMLSLTVSPQALVTARNVADWAHDEISRKSGYLEAEGILFALPEVQLLAPVPNPPSIRDFITFESHVKQSINGVLKFLNPRLAVLNKGFKRIFKKSLVKPPRLWYEIPAYYKGNPGSVTGHLADIEWPDFTEYLDYELEIGIYIGKQGRDIPREKAHEYIAGYTIFNDFSARDLQVKEMQLRLGPTKSKDFDTGNVMGPFLVTADEIQDPYNLEMVARVNGAEWSRGNSRDMYYRFEDLIAYVSRYETLYPGDFFGSGTVGNGCGLEHSRWLKPGDVVELEVEGLGILQNRILKQK
jgi:2-keto-4-pentenoate hydratase/2-oxohepta-3-ene-1,7-dioic acid hydratase in catechol pathway